MLLYARDGRIAGSVSGGCVEGAAFEEIQRARQDGHSRVIRYGISDEQAWDVGLACGGTIDVLVEPRRPRRPRSIAAARGSMGADGRWRRRDHAAPRRSRRQGEFDQHQPRRPGAPPAPVLIVHEDGRLDGTLTASLELVRPRSAQLVTWRRRPSKHGMSRTVRIGDQWLFIEAYPVRPRRS